MQCCTYSKWVSVTCTLLSFSRFRTLGSSHSWSFPHSASLLLLEISHLPTVTSSSDSSSLYTPLFNLAPLLMQHFHPTLAFKPLIPFLPTLYLLSLCTFTTVSCSWLFLYTFCFLIPPDSIWVFQWITGDLQAKSTKLLHFISSHLVDLICIQESNFNSFSSFRIPGFSAL